MYLRTKDMLGEAPLVISFDSSRTKHIPYRPALGLGQNSPTEVTTGEFARALRSINPPELVIRLLKLSNTFRSIAGKLNRSYVHLWNPEHTRHRPLTTSNAGVVTKGPFKGRRVLEIELSSTGSRFDPGGSPDNHLWSSDLISIERLAPTETGRWLEVIAHEAVHARNFLTRGSPKEVTLCGRASAAIKDEIATRRIESTVISEIMKTAEGRRALRGYAPRTGGTDAHVVERDFFPADSFRTYLEHFVLSELMRDAIKREGLDFNNSKAKNQEVLSIPLKGWRDRIFSSDYSKLRFWLRVIDFRWQQARRLRTPGTPGFERLKEQLLQEHANAFFGGICPYTKP